MMALVIVEPDRGSCCGDVSLTECVKASDMYVFKFGCYVCYVRIVHMTCSNPKVASMAQNEAYDLT